MKTEYPPGVRFCPTDKELVVDYLQQQAKGRTDFSGLVIDYDIYSCEPWKLPARKGGKMFFFTSRHPMGASRCNNASSSHVRRTAGDGSWVTNSSIQFIRDDDNKAIIGSKMALVFKHKNKETRVVTKTAWMMQEYLLPNPSNQFQKLALYKIYRNGKKDVAGGQGAPLLMKRKMNSEPSSTYAASSNLEKVSSVKTYPTVEGICSLDDTSCFDDLEDIVDIGDWQV